MYIAESQRGDLLTGKMSINVATKGFEFSAHKLKNDSVERRTV